MLDTCDLARSRCVQCIDGTDCDGDEACVEARCLFFCGADADCRGGEVCDEDAGTCRVAECVDDDGCRGGFVCSDGACVNILPVICDAGAVSCDGNSVASCNVDGTAFDRVDCGGEAACRDGACAAVVCEANDFGCDDDDTAFVCDSSGTVRELLACRADQYCSAGAPGSV